MSFPTNPSAIAEISGYVDKRLTNAVNQLAQTDPKDPVYDYLLERIAYLSKNSNAIKAMVGKKLPESKRDRWLKILGKV